MISFSDLADHLERLAQRLREEGPDALAHAGEWQGSGFPSKAAGASEGSRGGGVAAPTENAALRRKEAAVEAAAEFPALVAELRGNAMAVWRSLNALKVVLAVERLCVQCGGEAERPHFHNDRPYCQGCHDEGSWRREQKREWMRTYRSDMRDLRGHAG